MTEPVAPFERGMFDSFDATKGKHLPETLTKVDPNPAFRERRR